MSGLAFPVPDDFLQMVAERVAEVVLEQVNNRAVELSPYMTPDEAAEYLRCERQRIYDLQSAGRLSRIKEGGRTLVLREEVEARIKCERRAWSA